MSLQRVEYWDDLITDAQQISSDAEVISALILADSYNGLRKALLDISEAVKHSSKTQTELIERLNALSDALRNGGQA